MTRFSSLPAFALCALMAAPSPAAFAATTADTLLTASVTALDAKASPEGIALARQAYGQATTQSEKYIAARLVARGYAEDGKDTRAQIWLRLARQNATGEAEAQSVAEDYAFLRDRNPLSVNLTFGITPTSNVNNGSSAETSDLFGLGLPFTLNPEARALSGMSYTAGAQLAYRISETPTSITHLTTLLDATTYTLSKDARAKLPAGSDVKGSDYGTVDLAFGLSHRQIFAAGLRPTDLSLQMGQTWYGGDAYSRQISAGMSQSFLLGERDLVDVSLNLQKRFILESDDEVFARTLGVSLRHAFDNGSVSGVFASATRSVSDDGDQDFSAVRVGVSHDLGQPLAGIDFGFAMDYEVRDFENSTLAAGARTNKTVTASVTAVLTQIEYYGFQPVITVDASRTDSTQDLFDREGINVGFDLRSSF